MLFFLRVIILGSLLAVWFLLSYIIFEFIGAKEVNISSRGEPENIVAALGNYDSSRFLKELSHVYSMKPSIAGVVDSLEVQPDATLRFSGWAVDKDDSRQHLTIFMVVPKKAILVTKTGRMREDVRIALRLSKEFELIGFDDTFKLKIDCADKELGYYFIAVNKDKKQFAAIRPPKRLSGCGDGGTGQ